MESSQYSILFVRMKIKDIEDDNLLHIIAKFIPCQIFSFVTWYWMKKKHPKVACFYIKHRKVQFRMKITTFTVFSIINSLSSINKTKDTTLNFSYHNLSNVFKCVMSLTLWPIIRINDVGSCSRRQTGDVDTCGVCECSAKSKQSLVAGVGVHLNDNWTAKQQCECHYSTYFEYHIEFRC